MGSSGSLRCVVIGNESLLIQCSELLLKAGHQIVAVVSEESTILDWASGKNIETYEQIRGLATRLPSFDYLFSIANLSYLPKVLIDLPGKGAINFHDGPLPRYAGLNTPNWALINQEQSHGITWHLMTDEVDAGDILIQRNFDIANDETAFTLNVKCYDAALHGFETLIAGLGSETGQPQDFTDRVVYSRDQRPSGAAVIDWSQSAGQIDALVRALDFGSYKNPLGCAKIVLDDRAYIVSRVALAEEDQKGSAGSVLAIDASRIVIAARSGAIVISELLESSGSTTSLSEVVARHKLVVGSQIEALSQQQQQCFSEYNKAICTREAYWIERLMNLTPVELPVSASPDSAVTTDNFVQKRFDTTEFAQAYVKKNAENARHPGAAIAAMFGLYLARTSGKNEFDLAFNHPGLMIDQPCADALFSDVVPLRIVVGSDQTTDHYLDLMLEEIDTTAGLPGYTRDIVARSPQLHVQQHPWHEQPPGILVSCVTESGLAAISESRGCCNADLALVIPDSGEEALWCYNRACYGAADIERIEHQFRVLLGNSILWPDRTVDALPLLSEAELHALAKEGKDIAVDYPKDRCIHQLIEAQAENSPNAEAIVFRDRSLSYAELDQKANQVAHYLINKGVGPGSLVGVMLDRSLDLIPAMVGIWKAGGAYVPLDPAYPKDRLAFMAEDAGLALVITTGAYKDYLPEVSTLLLDNEAAALADQASSRPATTVTSADLAYIIYTSGSTGKPKGVMIEHRNAVNFFAGMDQRVGSKEPGVWLAVTSISFDISVLELFWTLSRGFKVVIYNDADQHSGGTTLGSRHPDINMDFSLFYWNVVSDQNRHEKEKYCLLMESAKYGDANGFKAVWTPERHFGSFGGVFPNPSVISAAIAVQTKQIEIRSGSCVLPLHSPIRAAEEWAVVDNLSNGRVGLGIAAGWQPNDFVIKPENHANAKEVMFESIEILKQLWRGEKVVFPSPDGKEGGVEVETLPRPIQSELPIWITVAGNPDTYKKAGQIGANVLTHLLGQSVEQVAENIGIYRQARKEAGHSGDGRVTLLLHTLVGDSEEEVKALSRQPMKDYLLSAVFLVKAAAWHFPTFKELSEDTGKTLDEYFATISDEDLDAVLDFAFERYYTRSGLFGTTERCMAMVDQLKEIGVNEIGCLIDYGLATDKVLEHLPDLNVLRQAASRPQSVRADDFTIPGLIRRHGVTHFQCTPSMANMLASDEQAHDALRLLHCMMVGGEALPDVLAKQLKSLVNGSVTNMYGPTETTIWSSTYLLGEWTGAVPLGLPIANTQIYALDQHLQPLPHGVAGELVIAGDGVARGYLNRPELTDERFVMVAIDAAEAAARRMYRTGDLGRVAEDGTLEFLGRIDHQVKVLGYRIELGEIETVVQGHAGVKEVVVIPREDNSGVQSLVGYVVPTDAARPVTSEELKAFARNSLPEYMVPGNFVYLGAFPLTPNGKVDRKALPALEQSVKPLQTGYLAPENELEQVIAQIWKDVLDLDQVGVNDNFFDLGGHSLLVVRALTRLRKEVDPNIQVVLLFQHTTIKTLAQHLKSDGETVATDVGQNRAEARRKASPKRRRRSGNARNQKG